MKLLALTLVKGGAINACIQGSFSGAQGSAGQELVVAHGTSIELLRAEPFSSSSSAAAAASVHLRSVARVDVFGVVRSLAPFRLPGTARDYVVVGSDSGRVAVLSFSGGAGRFERAHLETFGRSGCRRIVPGEHVAADPRGRAAMVAAAEKQKLVYVLNRDARAQLTISSPLEAHKGRTVCYALAALDVGFENPLFAALEREYADFRSVPAADSGGSAMRLAYYELDLGLNHVARKWADDVDGSACALAACPGWRDGPGGVVVCAANCVYWHCHGKPVVKAPLPRRRGFPAQRELAVTSVALHKQKGLFFFLLQTELGDIYKLSLKCTSANVVEGLELVYLDTLPVASSIAILRSGFLFLAAEFGSHFLYRFQGLGSGSEDFCGSERLCGMDVPVFEPRPLKNLVLADEVQSLSPIMDMRALNAAYEESARLYCLCGRGSRSALRILRHGLAVNQIALTQLPRVPTAVWTVRQSAADTFDRFIVIAFPASTMVLSIGSTIEEVSSSGMLGTAATLAVGLLGEDSIVQVHTGGVRIVRADRRIQEWQPPGHRVITHAATNGQQVVIVLAGGQGEIFYFELDSSGQLNEAERCELGHDVASIDIAPATNGRRARYMAVSDFAGRARVLSLTPDACLQQASVQVVPATAQSVCLAESSGDGSAPVLHLNVGLQNGIMFRSTVDPVTGELSDTRTRFLGSRASVLRKVQLEKNVSAVMAISSRTWLCRSTETSLSTAPLAYDAQLTDISAFSSEQCVEGFVAVADNTLRIFSVDYRGSAFTQYEVPFPHTPRRLLVHPVFGALVTIETDHNALSTKEKQEALAAASSEHFASDTMDTDDQQQPPPPPLPLPPPEQLDERVFGAPAGGEGKWASAVRVLEPVEGRTMDVVEMENNEAALSLCICVFRDYTRPLQDAPGAAHSKPQDEALVVVGTAKDMKLHPRHVNGGFLRVYRIDPATGKLSLVHTTPVEDAPQTLCAFQGRLVVGIGNTLRLYELGKKQLLRKCELKSFGNIVCQLHPMGDRIAVGDVNESYTWVKYHREDNRFVAFANDTVPRFLTCGMLLDYDTIACADKFGTFAVVRLPTDVSEDVDEDPTGALLADRSYLGGAPYRTSPLCHFYLGDTITSLQRTALVPGSPECVVYSTVLGSIGAFIPFESREDAEFFERLEMHMRSDNPPLCGRDHMAFRGAYFPVKEVVDGDLCEQFASLDPAKQQSIAQELDRTPSEVIKKLEDIRHTHLL